MTTEELKAIRERADKATAGPWGTLNHEEWHGGMGCTPDGCHGHDSDVAYDVDGPHLLRDGEPVGESEQDEKRSFYQADLDAKFIAHARSDVPALCVEVERLQKAVAEARAIIEHVGWTSVERANVIMKAEQWMKENP